MLSSARNNSRKANTQNHSGPPICTGRVGTTEVCGWSVRHTFTETKMNGTLAMPKSAIAHEVWINRESLLWTILEERLEGEDTCSVNSRHHQSVKQVAPGFVVSATAPDGVIEGIERPSARFCVGVQWHPEWRAAENPVSVKLFRRFGSAAGAKLP